MTRKIAVTIAAVLYFGLASHLPNIGGRFLRFGLINPLRVSLCRIMFKKCGKNVVVDQGVFFAGYNVDIGDYSTIASGAHLDTSGGIVIGNNVMIGPGVVILTGNHKHDDITRPMQSQGVEIAPVLIEDDVWIGLRAIILPGIRIGRSSIIGAAAVVTKDVPPLSIVVGNPARVVKKREGSAPSVNVGA